MQLIAWFLLLFAVASSSSLERKVTYGVNPGCTPSVCSNLTGRLIHVRSESEKDILHHLWDFTTRPSILLALTPLETDLVIDWSTFLWDGNPDSVKFTKDPLYIYSIVLDTVIDFNDANNTGKYDPNNSNDDYSVVMNTQNFSWNLKDISQNKNSSVKAVFVGSNYTNDNGKSDTFTGAIKISLNAFGTEDHSTDIPHLLHSSNASQVEIVFDGLKPNANTSRLAVKLFTVSSEPSTDNVTLNSFDSLDDQHSPGIFEETHVLTSGARSPSGGGFLAWRNVVYTSVEKALTNSTGVTTDVKDEAVLPPVDLPFDVLNGTLIFSLLGSELSSLSVASLNVAFGSPSDEFYQKTRYLSWTFVTSYGHVPDDGFFEILVTLILVLGIGVPALIILSGIAYMIFRSVSTRRDQLFTSQ